MKPSRKVLDRTVGASFPLGASFDSWEVCMTTAIEHLRLPRILVVEDVEAVQTLTKRHLESLKLSCDISSTLADAHRRMSLSRYDLLIVDVGLPDGSGLSLVGEKYQGPLVVVMTGSADIQSAIQAFRRGAFDFIAKPFTAAEFRTRIARAVEEWRSRARLRYHAQSLKLIAKTMLSRSLKAIDDVHDETVMALVAAVNLKDHETADHCMRVSKNSVRLGSLMGLSAWDLKTLEWGAYLHDVGKIGVPENTLLKVGPLDPEERRTIEKHPVIGYDLIHCINFLENATDVVLYHHERFDGSGYPAGLSGSNIPTQARIFAIMDALDAITADRPYHGAAPIQVAMEEIGRGVGSQFDPETVEVFLSAPLSDWLVQEPVPLALCS